MEEVERIRHSPDYRLIDARLPERYRGEVEPIDKVAGHIPGALNFPYSMNLSEDGTLLPSDEIRMSYSTILAGIPPGNAVFYCGSGVTSIISMIALLHAGLGQSRIYPGSWSEWIADGSRPIAVGPEL